MVATAIPATNNAAGFEALTWVDVKGLQTAPQLGSDHETVTSPNVTTGRNTVLKGAVTGTSSTSTVARLEGDAGQGNVKTLAEAMGEGSYGSVKLVRPTGARGADGVPAIETGDRVQYAFGMFSAYVENQASSDSEDGFSFNFQQNGDTVTATEPA
jgi:hypothetical protein